VLFNCIQIDNKPALAYITLSKNITLFVTLNICFVYINDVISYWATCSMSSSKSLFSIQQIK